ncbi:hypothetical protein ABS767_02285 [Sphingomonas sp. ST-64]|uniref:Response regulatory domain-containing protein n=1 Tax=Sphingomonas plantiphila TaxID=3163295 RepID=A0ABW8YKK9_9SPHN
MSGEQVAKQARVVQPGLKVLFASGYTRDAVMHEARLEVGIDLISKPFTYAPLAAKVARLWAAKGRNLLD